MPKNNGEKEVDTLPKGERQDEGGSDTIKSAFAIDSVFAPLTAVPGIGDRVGTQYEQSLGYNVSGGTVTEDVSRHWTIPGVARIEFTPVYGTATTSGDPVNTMTQRLYATIVNAMRRTNLGFEAVDVVLHLLAWDSVHMLYNHISRGYRMLNTTNALSFYAPKQYCSACGIDYDSFLDNKAQIYFDLQQWAKVFEQYPVPKVFQALELHDQLSKYMYQDADSKKATMYVFCPKYLWTYTEVDTGKGLQAQNLLGTSGNGDMTYAELKRIMNVMINAIITSSDFSYINSCLRSAFEDAEMLSVECPGVNDTVPFVYDQAMLVALNNATILPVTGSTIGSFAPKDTKANYFTCTPSVSLAGSIPRLVNTITDIPSAVEMVNYMRWHADTVKRSGSTAVYDVKSMGTEIIHAIRIYGPETGIYNQFNSASMVAPSTQYNIYITSSTPQYSMNPTNEASATNAIKYAMECIGMLFALRGCEWLPIVYPTIIGVTASNAKKFLQSLPAGTWRNVFTVSGSEIANYHLAVLATAFGFGK